MPANYGVVGWTPDGQSLFIDPTSLAHHSIEVSKLNLQTGKMEPWKTFGEAKGAEGAFTGRPLLSSDGAAYAYLYVRILSEAYVVTGLK